jgi:hypothetical protein
MTNVSTYSDIELQQRLGAAIVDRDVKTETLLKQERDRRTLQPLADAERARRETALREKEAEALTQKFVALRDSLREQFVNELAVLAVTPQTEAWDVVEKAYVLGRQAYALSHDLAGALGDRRYAAQRYDVPDQLELHGGQVGKAFILGARGRPPVVPTPWHDDIQRLREIYVPSGPRIGNGG